MTLQQLERDVIETVLGVKPRKKGAAGRAGPERSGADAPGAEERAQGWLSDTVNTMAEKVQAAVSGGDPQAANKKKALLAQLAKLVDPSGITAEQAKALAEQRKKVTDQLSSDAPVPTELAVAAREMAALADMVRDMRKSKGVSDLAAANPQAAKEAQAAYDKFDKVLGGKKVTPETLKAASEDKKVKQTALDNAADAYEKAEKLPQGPARDQAMAAAKATYDAAKSASDAADALDDAMVGQQSLMEALDHGPLSPGSTKFDPAVAEKLVAAYAKSGRIAASAMSSATTAKYPAEVANQVGPMIDMAKGGFKSTSGLTLGKAQAEEYAQGLLQSGGQLGPAYTAGIADYVASGQQFVKDAAGPPGATAKQSMLNRSRTLAGALMDKDGGLDLASDGAKKAVGNILYSPEVIRNPTPGLNENVMRTVTMLKDPANAAGASAVLKGTKAPSDPAGQTLVRGAMGKGGDVTAEDARTAVLASMMQPFDQGDVGSCFSTGPLRKLRETQPVEMMKAYSELASKGQWTPKKGDPVQAVTNLPAGDDPLMRSLEYTVASAGARLADSEERDDLTKQVTGGLALLKGPGTKRVKKDQDKVWAAKQAKLVRDVQKEISFVYDPTVATGSSSDGSSSHGRYVVMYKNQALDTQQKFQDAMAEIAVASLKLKPGSPDANDVEAVVRSDAFAHAVCPWSNEKPWELLPGGFAKGTLEAMTGNKQTETQVVASAGDPPPAEGRRTEAVLEGLLKQFRGSPEQMATMDTAGQHSFNVLPNDPSFKALQGANDAEMQKNIKEKLLDPGKKMKDTALSAEQAGVMFDDAVQKWAGGIKDAELRGSIDEGIAKNRPKAAMKPAEVTAAAKAALAGMHDVLATRRTQNWKQQELANGKPVTPGDEAKHKAEELKRLENGVGNILKAAMLDAMKPSEIVIADTNWGGEGNHKYFVIVPDPNTGDPQMFIKTEPPGSLWPAGPDWINREWKATH